MQDFTFPLSSDDINTIQEELIEVEDDIAFADFHGVVDHDLNAKRNNLIQLFQDNNEWYEAHPTHW